MTDRPQYHDLITRNRRATWLLGFAFFLLLTLVGVAVALGTGGGLIAVIVGVVAAATVTSVGYFSAAPLALSSTGAHPATRDEYPQLHNVVEGVSIAAGIPVPAIYVVDDPAPNAFATGRRPEQAAVAATTGLLEKLSRDELEGVMAHEVAHIRNQDIRVMTLAVATAGSIALITDVFWRLLFFGGGRRRRGNDGANAIVVVGMIVVAVLAPLAAALLKAAVSRRREALADATAVEITRYPTGLRRALEKLDADTTVVSRTSHATSHLWIESPDDHDPDHRGSRLNNMFDTHPPLHERIDLLRRMEGLEGYAGPDPSVVTTTGPDEPDHPLTPAGWYVDPASATGRHRYWDGQAWTSHVT